MTFQFAHYSVSELASLVRRREVSPVELTTDSLEAIDAAQPALNAFITVCHERALRDARTAEAAVLRGDKLGPLHGVPFSAKDMLETEGVRTTYGTLALADHVPTSDCAAIRRMKNAGAILVGKTTTPEFASGCLTESPLFGRTRNAWHPERTSGGSSGGAAVSVAAGLVPIALATDSGGSTRIPAACNAVVGLKQTLGLIPDELTPDGFGSLVYINPLVRRAEDLPALLAVLGSAHQADPLSLMARTVVPTRIAYDLRGVRIGWMPRLGAEALDPEVLTLCEAAIERLAGLGAQVSELRVDAIPCFGAWSTIQNNYRTHRFGKVVDAARDKLSPRLLRMMGRSTKESAQDLMRAMTTRADVFRQVQEWFCAADFVITPTLTRTALPLDHDIEAAVEIAGVLCGPAQAAWFPTLCNYNLSGHPAISVPCGWASDGLPVAIQVAGRWGSDLHLSRLAELYQEAHPEALCTLETTFTETAT
ncbi:MAG TPA: amidase [Ramlibacter sp.]|nr:amidase [Ramlibacter sp.]